MYFLVTVVRPLDFALLYDFLSRQTERIETLNSSYFNFTDTINTRMRSTKELAFTL